MLSGADEAIGPYRSSLSHDHQASISPLRENCAVVIVEVRVIKPQLIELLSNYRYPIRVEVTGDVHFLHNYGLFAGVRSVMIPISSVGDIRGRRSFQIENTETDGNGSGWLCVESWSKD